MGGGVKLSLGRVLVVDDDAAVLRACNRILEAEGWHVVQADSGSAALAEISRATEAFDCVVSDVNMPDLDGFELLGKVRDVDDDIPVLLMTGDPSLDGAVKAIDRGAISYIAKPFDHEALASAVARAARRHGVERMRRRAEAYSNAIFAGGDMRELAARFTDALERSYMVYQPIFDVATGRIVSHEALIRTDEATLRRPDILIATAERLDKIHAVGRTVRAAVARMIAVSPPEMDFYVNVHGLELADEDLYSPTGPLAEHAERVVLEITERTGLDAVDAPSRVAMLRKLGYRIAIDDLGAGYAALGAIATIEPDIVKLDMSLVRDVDRHPKKRRMIGALATLCRELGSRVVAEGIETVAEQNVCTEGGVDLLQGFLLGKPSRELARHS